MAATPRPKPSSSTSAKPEQRFLFLSSVAPNTTRWDAGLVLRRIRERLNGGLSLESAVVRQEMPKLYDAARRYYGSWKEALKVAKSTDTMDAATMKEMKAIEAKNLREALNASVATAVKSATKPAKTTKPAASKKPAPHGACLHPYLTFNGTCEAAFKFYKKVFGGEFCCLMRFKDAAAGHGKLDAKLRNKVKHMGLSAGSMVLMGSDAWPNEPLTVGDNVSLSLKAPNTAEAKRIFQALSAKGTVHTPLAPTSWAEWFGVATDRFGICWSVSYMGDGQ